MQRLDRWLDAPLRRASDSRGHTVWLLGSVGYRVDRRSKSVYPVFRDPGPKRGAFTVDLGNYLRNPTWLKFVVRNLGLSSLTEQSRQLGLFATEEEANAELDWLCAQAYLRLRADPRFDVLRRERLPRAVGLDPTLRGIALAGRALPTRGDLGSGEYNLVWRHEHDLRIAARENPRLLPFVIIAIRESKLASPGDPIHHLRSLCLSRGLKPATWRFLVRHGVRWLRPVWASTRAGKRTEAAIDTLRAFERAGYPAPLPAREMREWAEWSAARPSEACPGDWRSVPAAVLAACCEGARDPEVLRNRALRAGIFVAFEWGSALQPRLDKLQRRAGWPWVRRQALAWERRTRLLEAGGPGRWAVPLALHEAGGFRARAIATSGQLVDAGLAFHNCLAEFATECRGPSVLMFVVSELASGREVAIVGLQIDAVSKEWVLLDVKGECNAGVSQAVVGFAESLRVAVNETASG